MNNDNEKIVNNPNILLLKLVYTEHGELQY